MKRLSILNGLAIIAVVVAHAGLLGQEAFYIWNNRNLPTTVPIGGRFDTFSYYALLAIRQLPVFSIPAFFFISGFFVAYTFHGGQNSSNRKIIMKRLVALLIPYLIYSFIIFVVGFLLGKKYTLIDYLVKLVSTGAIGAYWYIPVLSYFYILSLVIAPLAKSHWKALLSLSASIQLIAISLYYLYLLHVNIPGVQLFGKIIPYSSSIQSIFFLTFGIVFGTNIQKIRELLIPLRKSLVIALPAFALLNIIESDILMRTMQSIFSVAYLGSISFNLYSLTFLCWFITVENVPQSNGISWIGRKSYGIYLLHVIFMQGAAKLLNQFAPQNLNYQVLFMPLLISVGLGVPIIIMIFFEKTPARRFYHFLFG